VSAAREATWGSPIAVTGRSRSGRGERTVLRAVRQGSDEALEELFREHWPRAHRAAFLIVHDAATAEDVAQEAFLSAVRALHGFDVRRPFGPWLHRIVVNRAIDAVRARAARREVVGVTAEPVDVEHADTVIVMRHLLDMSPGEIARALGLPRGTVNSRLRRGLDGLRDPLGGQAR
jgi:RNA polymerase sigma-70 factor, ECF subfamily